ncbi:MAG: hypothetical protein ACC682_05080 [Gemmatimonadota bacterium]
MVSGFGIALIVAVGELWSGASAGVAAQETTLGEPVASRDEAFGLIGGVRELPDGSVLVADPLGGLLVRLDATLMSMETLGSEGEGPGEYGQPDNIWPVGRDRSILVDLGNARLSDVDPDGRIGDGTPIVLPAGEAGRGGMGGMLMALPGGSDANGHVYFAGSGFGPDGPRDSVELFRLRPGEGEPERVATLKAPELNVEGSAGSDMSISRVPMGPVDAWGVAPDGSLFIARVGDYSVEYVRANGAIRRGEPVAYRPVGIRMAEKEEWAAERSRVGGVMIDVAMGGGGRRTQMSRSTGGRRELAQYDWPDDMPAFTTTRISVDSDGNGWIRRSTKAGQTALYDVFNTLGERVKSVRFPADRTLISFGRGAMYVARIDEFDQQFLEKYDLP